MSAIEYICLLRLKSFGIKKLEIKNYRHIELSACQIALACIISSMGYNKFDWKYCKNEARFFIYTNIAEIVWVDGITCRKPRKKLSMEEQYKLFRRVYFVICHLNGKKYRRKECGRTWWNLKRRRDDKLVNAITDEDFMKLALLSMTQDEIENMYRREGGGCGLYDVSGNLFRQNV